MKRRVGDVVENPITKERAVFAGYVNGHEMWCEVGVDSSGEDRLCPPEGKTFLGFDKEWFIWQQDKAKFIEALVDSDTLH